MSGDILAATARGAICIEYIDKRWGMQLNNPNSAQKGPHHREFIWPQMPTIARLRNLLLSARGKDWVWSWSAQCSRMNSQWVKPCKPGCHPPPTPSICELPPLSLCTQFVYWNVCSIPGHPEVRWSQNTDYLVGEGPWNSLTQGSSSGMILPPRWRHLWCHNWGRERDWHLASRSRASCTLQCAGWHHREWSDPKGSSAEPEKPWSRIGLGTQLFLSKSLLKTWMVEYQACRWQFLAESISNFSFFSLR